MIITPSANQLRNRISAHERPTKKRPFREIQQELPVSKRRKPSQEPVKKSSDPGNIPNESEQRRAVDSLSCSPVPGQCLADQPRRYGLPALQDLDETVAELPISKRAPLNLSLVVQKNMPPWCLTVEDWKENAARLRLSIIAVCWFLVHEHGYEAILDRNGKIWVRKGRQTVVPLGGQKVTFGFVYPPPKTAWTSSMCTLSCSLARTNKLQEDCPEIIGCIATYEQIPADQVKQAMLPVGLFNSFAPKITSTSGPNKPKAVNGWVVFRSKTFVMIDSPLAGI